MCTPIWGVLTVIEKLCLKCEYVRWICWISISAAYQLFSKENLVQWNWLVSWKVSLIRLSHNYNCCNSCQLHTCLSTSENLVHWNKLQRFAKCLLSLARMCHNFNCFSRGQLHYINYVVKSSRVVTREAIIQVKVCKAEGRKSSVPSMLRVGWHWIHYSSL
jgi:hypothetical protein